MATPSSESDTPPRITAQSGNALGTIALWVGIAAFGIAIAAQLAGQMLPWLLQRYAIPVQEVWKVFAPFQILQSVLALIALGFGIAGLIAPHRPRGAAGAGTALGASMFIAVLMSVLGPLMIAAAMS